MKHFILSGILIFVFSISYSQPNTQTKKKPKIVFDNKMHDFGPLNEDITVTHSFKFINSGDAPLVIRSVNASCGCTTPRWSRQPVMPGDSGSIDAILRTHGFSGQKIHKSISVVTNVPQNGSNQVIILAFEAYIKRSPLNKKGTH